MLLGVQISFKAFLMKFNIYLFRNENTLNYQNNLRHYL